MLFNTYVVIFSVVIISLRSTRSAAHVILWIIRIHVATHWVLQAIKNTSSVQSSWLAQHSSLVSNRIVYGCSTCYSNERYLFYFILLTNDWSQSINNGPILKPIFHLANLFARTDKKVGTLPTCSRRIFSRANFNNQSRCPILVFASRRAKKVTKWKIGFKLCMG